MLSWKQSVLLAVAHSREQQMLVPRVREDLRIERIPRCHSGQMRAPTKKQNFNAEARLPAAFKRRMDAEPRHLPARSAPHESCRDLGSHPQDSEY